MSVEVTQAGIAAPSARSVPAAGAWIVLWTLCGVYVLNFLDRQLLAILAKPIEDTLHLTDGQLGRISGLYFAFFYCFIAIPVGWLADRTSRVKVLTWACAIWSAATACCGLAVSYPQLAIARMTVGFGEAGGVPPSYALISDYFPPARRGTALGIYNMGPGIGAALGTAFGAAIAAIFDWRYAFLSIGAAGVLASLGIRLLVREPARGAQDAHPAAAAAAGFWETVGTFCSRPTLVLAALGSGAAQFITYGVSGFTTLYLQREKGMTLDQIAIWYALVQLFGVCGSMYVSGRLIDRLTQRSRSAYALLPAASLLLAIPCYLGFLGAPSWQLALWPLLGAMFFNYFYLSSAVALVQEEVPPHQRVMCSALLLLVMNFIGLGLGPTYVGYASDQFHAAHPEHSLHLALSTLTIFYVIASLIFLALAYILRGGRHAPGCQTP
jgi:MFS family permease